jgi:hypothetical protein
MAAGLAPWGVAVNPVTNKTYVTNMSSNTVTVITDAPANDAKVWASFDRLPGDTTTLARPALTGTGANRWTSGRTTMMGVGIRVNTAHTTWNWATVTSGAGTDSITWSYNWGPDSLHWGENLVYCVPLEDQAATTNNLGLGTPFAGNLDVYPVYRTGRLAGQEEVTGPEVRRTKLPTIVRGVLLVSDDRRPGTGDRVALLDIAGRSVLDLKAGTNDVRALAPGVYFVHSTIDNRPSAMSKIVLTR